MWQRLAEWAFPVRYASDRYAGRWKRFETHHDFLGCVVALVVLGAFGAVTILSAMYLPLVAGIFWITIFGLGLMGGLVELVRFLERTAAKDND